jgi:hypothetical protein
LKECFFISTTEFLGTTAKNGKFNYHLAVPGLPATESIPINSIAADKEGKFLIRRI